MNFQMFKLDLELAEEPEIKLPTSARPSKKQESSRKTSTFALSTVPKLLLCGSQQTVENSRDGDTRRLDLPPDKSVCRLGSNRMSHGTDWFPIGRLYIGHPAYLTYMQSTS